MKIIGGKYKNRNFYMPVGIKPTQNVLRAAVFDVLGHDWEGMSLLELYAGSGAISMEAISRGASEVLMVEHNPKNVSVIRENCELLGIELGGDFKLVQADALASIKRLASEGKRFDVVFFDPPYGLKLAKKTLKLLEGNDILSPHCFIVAQYDQLDSFDIPEVFTVFKQRIYGSSYLTILQRVQRSPKG